MSNLDYTVLVVDDTAYKTKLTKKYLNRKLYKRANPKEINSFIPATIGPVYVKPGDSVTKGQALMICEAMKMKNDLQSPDDGVIKNIYVKTGDIVKKGQLLLDFE